MKIAKTIYWRTFLVVWFTALGCQSESSVFFPDTTSFDLVKMDEILQNIHPNIEADYLELRMSFGEDQAGAERFSVVDSVGRKCMKDSIGTPIAFYTACMENVSNLPIQKTGFNMGCQPGYCFYYLVSTSAPKVEVWNSAERLIQLFGEIDTADEAALIVFANGYSFNSSDHRTSGTSKTRSDSFEVVCTKMVAFCAPIITNLYLLEVSKSGDIKILNQREYRRENNICI